MTTRKLLEVVVDISRNSRLAQAHEQVMYVFAKELCECIY